MYVIMHQHKNVSYKSKLVFKILNSVPDAHYWHLLNQLYKAALTRRRNNLMKATCFR